MMAGTTRTNGKTTEPSKKTKGTKKAHRNGSKGQSLRRPKAFGPKNRPKAASKIPLMMVLLSLILGALVGVGSLAYNSDTYYYGDRTNAIMSLPDVIEAGSPTKVLVATEHKDGTPKPDQDVKIKLRYKNGTQELFSGSTDSNGLLVADIQVPQISGEGQIILEAGGERLVEPVKLVNASSSPKARVIISSDKPLYQPGQIVHLRTISFGGSGFNAAQGPIVLQVTDPNGDRIFRETHQSNEYGIATCDYPLSDKLPLGTYVFRASLSEEVFTDLPVVVKRYVLPKFHLELDGIAAWYRTSDQLHGVLNATYMFGEPVNGSTKIIAKMQVNKDYSDTQGNINQGTTVIDANKKEYNGSLDAGQFGFNINLNEFQYISNRHYYRDSAKYMDYLAYKLDLGVTVTDEAGHKETKNFTVDVATVPYHPLILADSFMRGHPAMIYMLVLDPSDRPVRGLTVMMSYSYNSGADGNHQTVETDERGLATINLVYQGDGELSFEISNHGYNTSYYNYNIQGDSKIKVEAKYRLFTPGDTAEFTVTHTTDSSSGEEILYYQVVSEGLVVTGGLLLAHDGVGSLFIPVTEMMAPASELRVYKVLRSGDIVMDSVLFAVERPMDLSVAIQPSKTNCRTGEAMGVDLTVADPENGLDGPAAIGVKIVDQSVYELGERLVSQDDVFHGLQWSTQSPRYEVANYMFSPGAPLPSFKGIAYEHDGGMTRGQFSIYSSYNEYMDVAGPRKDELVNDFWSALMFTGVLCFMSVVGWGVMNKMGKNGIAALMGTLMAALIIGAIFASAMPSLVPQQSGTNDPGSLKLQSNYQPNKKPGTMSAGFGFDFPTPPPPKQSTTENKVTPDGASSVQRKLNVRDYFPETWYWNPFIVTDASGKAHLDLTTPDTITTWGIDAAASTKDGRFGLAQANITVFQEFFVEPDLPAFLVRNDTIELPTLVYNYLDKELNVTVSVKPEPWMEVTGNLSQDLLVPSKSTRSVNFTIRALEVGLQKLTVGGVSGGLNDVVVKEVVVLPNGKLMTYIQNGELADNDDGTVFIVQSPYRINGSENAYIKLLGSMTGVALDGAQNYIRFALGCGEQSTSVLTVNLAAYRNLQLYGKDPEALASVKAFIQQSIQYESQFLVYSGGGRAIAWHPGEPADLWLTAWAAFAYKDLENAGFDIDERILDGFEVYLLSNQGPDGSWDFPEIGHWSMNSDLQNKKVTATAYIVRSLLYAGHPVDAKVKSALDYITSHIGTEEDAFTVAISLLALSMAEKKADLRGQLSQRLIDMKTIGPNEGQVNWGTVENTAYAVLALANEGTSSGLITQGLNYLIGLRENGVWRNTHSTAVALQALNMEGAFSAKDVTVTVNADGKDVKTVHIDEDNNDLVFYVDLRSYLNASNNTKVKLSSAGSGRVLYQVIYEENIPWSHVSGPNTQLTLNLHSVQKDLPVGRPFQISIDVAYKGDREMLKMVLLEVPMAVGFKYDENQLNDLVKSGSINDFEILLDGTVRFYIDGLTHETPRTITFTMTPGIPGTMTMQGIQAYDMYNMEGSDLRATLGPVTFHVFRSD